MDKLSVPSVVINLIALSRSSDLTIELAGAGIGAYNELMMIFAAEIDEEHRKMMCRSLNKNTPELRGRVLDYINRYKDKNPKIYRLSDYFKCLEDGEMFFICPTSRRMPFNEYEALFNYLVSIRDGLPYETVVQQTADIFGNLRQLYDIKAYGDMAVYIGEPDKKKRICRFCGLDAGQTKFSDKAHTISKSLGNNLIVTNDECDTCNHNFGENIECDFAEYVGVFRTMMGLRGYNSIPHIKGENFDIKQEDGQVKLNYYASAEEEKGMPIEDMHLPLRSNQKIKLQNVYRSIVKYALSVIDAEEMTHFRDTVEWIFGRKTIEKLPVIATLQVPSFYKKQPHIIVYKRNVEDRSLPYLVTEFHFGHLVFVAIVPSSDMDDADFTNKEDYQRFWHTFNHFSSTSGWEFKDYSSDVDDTFTTNLNISKAE